MRSNTVLPPLLPATFSTTSYTIGTIYFVYFALALKFMHYTVSPRFTTISTYDVSRLQTHFKCSALGSFVFVICIVHDVAIANYYDYERIITKLHFHGTQFMVHTFMVHSLYHLPQLPLPPQLLHHLINTVLYCVCFYSCDKELFSVFLIKYCFALFVHFITVPYFTVQYDMYRVIYV